MGFAPIWKQATARLPAIGLGIVFSTLIWEGLKERTVPFLGDNWEPHEPLFRGIIGLYFVLAGLFFWLAGLLSMNVFLK
jgi:hypothetical protein